MTLANNFINFLKIILRFLIVLNTLLVKIKKICIIEHGENELNRDGRKFMDCMTVTMYRMLDLQAIRCHKAKNLENNPFKFINHETFGNEKSFFMSKINLKAESSGDSSNNKDFDVYI